MSQNLRPKKNIAKKRTRTNKYCIAIIRSNCCKIKLSEQPELIELTPDSNVDQIELCSGDSKCDNIKLNLLRIENKAYPFLPYSFTSETNDKSILVNIFPDISSLLSEKYACVGLTSKKGSKIIGPYCKKHFSLLRTRKKINVEDLFTHSSFEKMREKVSKNFDSKHKKRLLIPYVSQDLASVKKMEEEIFVNIDESFTIRSCIECDKNQHSKIQKMTTEKSFSEQELDEVPCHCSFCLKISSGMRKSSFNSEKVRTYFPDLFNKK